MRLAKLAVASALVVTGCALVPGCAVEEEFDGEEMGETDSAFSVENNRAAFRFFVNKGLTKNQSAGIVGNLVQESGMNPKSKQLGGGPGRGIAQWSVNERWKTHNTFAKGKGLDPWSLDAQLQFVWHELSTVPSFGLAQLKKAATLDASVRAFQDKFERCGKCETSKRVAFAKTALDTFGKEAAEVAPDEPATTDEDPVETPAGGQTPAGGLPDDVASLGDCIVDGQFGDCISTADCKAFGGTSTPNLCPGARNIQCCTPL